MMGVQFSVVIPTRNRPEQLAACLDSFLAVDYPHMAWELIVVNDGGEQSFTAVTPHHHAQLPLRLIDSDGQGPAAARNKGAALANGRFLAFTDDDCRVSPHWLRAWEAGFAQTGCPALGGQTRTPFAANRGAAVSQWLADFLADYMRDVQGNQLLLLSNNVAYDRHFFEQLGGFDESFPLAAAEDWEFSQRVVAAGACQRLWPDAVVWHHHRMSWRRHVAQQFRYGRGGHYFERALSRRGGGVQPVAAHPFYRTLVKRLWQEKRPFADWLLLGVGQVAYQLGRHYERRMAK